ncbi:MAG: DUF4345 family protein [Pseudomonadota bacterium]
MVRVYQFLIGAFALLFLFMGIGFVMNPVQAGGGIGLEAMTPEGMNALRGDLSGLFLASAGLLIWALVRPNPYYLRAVAVLMLAIAAGRVTGFVTDPLANDSLIAFVVELVTAAVLLRAAVVPPWRREPIPAAWREATDA